MRIVFSRWRLADFLRTCRRMLAALLGSRMPLAEGLYSLAPKPRDGLPGRDWPLHVQLETASFCNGRCTICPYHGSWLAKHPGKMDEALYERILSDLSQYKLGKLCVYLQNEPFADKRWFDMARQAIRRLNFQHFEVSTNLVLLDEQGIKDLIAMVRPIPHDIWISFHGADRESYERIMGLDFDKACANIETFARIAGPAGIKYRIHGYGLPYDTGSKAERLFDENQYKAFFDSFAKERGLSSLPIRFFKYHDRAGALADAKHSFNFHRESLKGFYCHRLDTWLHIRYTGEVISCCNDYSMDNVLGNLTKQTIEEFFKSPPYFDFRDKGLGLTDSNADFICKCCIKPGG